MLFDNFTKVDHSILRPPIGPAIEFDIAVGDRSCGQFIDKMVTTGDLHYCLGVMITTERRGEVFAGAWPSPQENRSYYPHVFGEPMLNEPIDMGYPNFLNHVFSLTKPETAKVSLAGMQLYYESSEQATQKQRISVIRQLQKFRIPRENVSLSWDDDDLGRELIYDWKQAQVRCHILKENRR